MSIFLITLFGVLFLTSTKASSDHTNNSSRVYVVYMGSAAPNSLTSTSASLRTDHASLLASLSKRKANALVHIYKHGFSGFAARLTEEEASSMARKPGVVSVFPDPMLQLHTTHSWEFLEYQTASGIYSIPNSIYSKPPVTKGSDTIIGILDTGIWPESESFHDNDMGPIPLRWKGTCMKGPDFDSSRCNRKLIGARFYNSSDDLRGKNDSPRDFVGHGTHVASTAAGSVVPGASYHGLAAGTAKGGSPGSRIAMYKVCTAEGCSGSTILAAFDDAISDGVDVLSLSLGSSGIQPDLASDPIAIGAFHAAERGILVVSSAGNGGPERETVANFAPWLLTVAASTIDRNFESNVVTGNKVIKGQAINFSRLQRLPTYPLIYALSAKTAEAEDLEARNCDEMTLEPEMIEGKIVICDTDFPVYTPEYQVEAVKSLGGVGVIFARDDAYGIMADIYRDFPATAVNSKYAKDLFSYINSTRNPVATILPTITVTKYKPAPTIPLFSSRGPSAATSNILKPDIAAPGVDILAAWTGNDTAVTPGETEPSKFNVLSGTSMACPHVSGIAATVKSQNPTWGPSAIRSAIMTTATQTNNLKAPITTDSNSIATPYDYGAGEVTTTGPLQPGLVYETDTIDYLNYLCYYGFDKSMLKIISRTIPDDFACPIDSKADYISNINYPSIAISKFNGKESRRIRRTVTNVAGDGEMVFIATVDAPSGLSIKVIPDQLRFSKNNQKLTYLVIFSSTASSAPKEDMFGSLTWSSGKYKVRSPIVVTT